MFAAADRATHGAEDPEDGTHDQQDGTDRVQERDAKDNAQQQKHKTDGP